ncbi:hypothetical protein [Bradyrhizobium prioriisuperbiae]|uniref:hypothetical protein n=1 Tax=Bradyrhizobium prioriisuperbiae TaxID=2854389 RepID=UPI0028E3246A|nr:hypothetical protein [Bradyrhizobium prioritasuperba]
MLDKNALCARLVGLLASPAVQQIDFSFGQYRVNSSGFRAVSTALLMKTLGYVGIDIDIGGVPIGAGAAYDPNTDKLLFPTATFGGTLTEQMIIVHECVHAIFDIEGFKFTGTYTENEGAAYVAGALYYRRSNGGGHFADEPKKTADRIARSIINAQGAVVPSDQVIALRSVIANHPEYRKLGVTMGTLALDSGLKH